MADHLDAPGLSPPGGDARIDITDVYAFQKPSDSNKSILIMNVNPIAPTMGTTFRSDAIYELKVDTDADALANVAYRVKFTAGSLGSQTATVRRATGAMAVGRDNIGDVIFNGAATSSGSTPTVTTTGSRKFFAGIRSDPFFFDLAWFLAGLPLPHTTGVDFFVDKNVFGIVLEVPNTDLGTNPAIGVWARVLIPQEDGSMLQVDRMGRPAINTVFNKGAKKLMFNRAEPIQDRARFTDDFVHVLESLGGALGGTSYDAAHASAIAGILLPDLLTYNYNSSAGFVPDLNGRKLQDDVIDFELGLVTNGARTTDGVGPHGNISATFPFMGAPV